MSGSSYRMCILDPAGHILVSHTVACADDLEALEAAEQECAGRAVEVWHESRLVARVKPDNAPLDETDPRLRNTQTRFARGRAEGAARPSSCATPSSTAGRSSPGGSTGASTVSGRTPAARQAWSTSSRAHRSALPRRWSSVSPASQGTGTRMTTVGESPASKYAMRTSAQMMLPPGVDVGAASRLVSQSAIFAAAWFKGMAQGKRAGPANGC